MKNKLWEVQECVDGKWEALWTDGNENPLRYATKKEADDKDDFRIIKNSVK